MMTKMRGCGCFDALWKERTTIEDAEGLIRVAGEYPDLLKQMIKERPLMKELEAM